MELGNLKEIRISSNMIYRGKILDLRVDTVQLPNGNESKREVVDYTGAVAIVALTEKREILLVRQYRYPAEREFIEIPAGKLEVGEKTLECAKRELLEETGARAGEWKELFSFYSTPGFSNEEMHVFLALDLEFQEQDLDEDEFVEVQRVPFQKALEMVWAGDINDAKTIVGILGAQGILK
jgi:ADP-ribose pyrophosphatase